MVSNMLLPARLGNNSNCTKVIGRCSYWVSELFWLGVFECDLKVHPVEVNII